MPKSEMIKCQREVLMRNFRRVIYVGYRMPYCQIFSIFFDRLSMELKVDFYLIKILILSNLF